MAFKKGHAANPKGRPRGAQSKSTLEFKEAVTNLLTISAPRFNAWMDKIAEDDPARAIDLLSKLAEYAFPKLARVEQQQLDKDGKPADSTVKVTFVSGNRDT